MRWTPEFEAKTEALLKSMDMWDCRNRHPFSLSGGQMQRLTLMMAYLSDKPIVILDEPTAGQDAGKSGAVRSADPGRCGKKRLFSSSPTTLS